MMGNLVAYSGFNKPYEKAVTVRIEIRKSALKKQLLFLSRDFFSQ